MIPINSKEELDNYCQNATCKNCSIKELNKLCDYHFPIQDWDGNRETLLEKLFIIILRHNRKEKLEKLLS